VTHPASWPPTHAQSIEVSEREDALAGFCGTVRVAVEQYGIAYGVPRTRSLAMAPQATEKA